MNRIFERIGEMITSIGAVIFVLMMTVVAMTFCSKTVFLEIFPVEMGYWEKQTASWILGIAWELTILVTVSNTVFINKRVPIVLAVCSGFVILFFVHAFDDLTALEYFKRWFIGILVASMNIVFSSLFYAKWCNSVEQNDLVGQLAALQAKYDSQCSAFVKSSSEITQAKIDFDQLFKYTEELEAFKLAEINKLTCPYCREVQRNIYHLASHKGWCSSNPEKKRLETHEGKSN